MGKSTAIVVRHLRTKQRLMVNEESPNLASITTDDSKPAVVSTLTRPVNVDKLKYHNGTSVEFATVSDEDPIAWWMREANP